MLTDQSIQELLSELLRNSSCRAFVNRIVAEDYVNADDEAALRVTIVLRDDISDDDLLGEPLGHLRRSIRDKLLRAGEFRFPYIFLTTEADLSRPREEDD